MNGPDMQEALESLSHPSRLVIFGLLLRYGELTVEQITLRYAQQVGRPLAQPTISHHLRLLRTGGVVQFYKMGLYSYYSLNRQTLTQIKDQVDAWVLQAYRTALKEGTRDEYSNSDQNRRTTTSREAASAASR